MARHLLNPVDGMMDRMMDEVPVFELDGSFYKPAFAVNQPRALYYALANIVQAGANPSEAAKLNR
jgi:hypothetical protein